MFRGARACRWWCNSIPRGLPVLQAILAYRLDLIAFFVVSLTAAFIISERVLVQRTGMRARALWWLGLAALVVVGVVVALFAEDRQREQLRSTFAGMAPTYAQEFS